MANQGYILIYRSIMDNPDYLPDRKKNEKLDRVRAWIDLLLLANHTKYRDCTRGVFYTVERGQVGTPLSGLSERWNWSINRVKRFLKELENEKQISMQKVQGIKHLTTITTIINYEQYQQQKGEKRKADGRQTEDKRNTDESETNNVNNVNNVNNKKTKVKKVTKDKEKDLYLDFVKLTKIEHEKLVKKFGEKQTEEMIWNLNDYGHRKKKKFNEYTDHYRTILNWERRAGNESKNNRGRKQEPIKKAKSKSSYVPGRETIITIENKKGSN